MHLCTDFGDLGLELPDVGRPVLDSGEDVGEETVQERDVFCHQFRYHGFTHTLDQNLLRERERERERDAGRGK